MIEFILGMACGAVLIILSLIGDEAKEIKAARAKLIVADQLNHQLDEQNKDFKDLLEQQKDHIEYLTQANQTLRQNKGRIPREDEQ